MSAPTPAPTASSGPSGKRSFPNPDPASAAAPGRRGGTGTSHLTNTVTTARCACRSDAVPPGGEAGARFVAVSSPVRGASPAVHGDGTRRCRRLDGRGGIPGRRSGPSRPAARAGGHRPDPAMRSKVLSGPGGAQSDRCQRRINYHLLRVRQAPVLRSLRRVRPAKTVTSTRSSPGALPVAVRGAARATGRVPSRRTPT